MWTLFPQASGRFFLWLVLCVCAWGCQSTTAEVIEQPICADDRFANRERPELTAGRTLGLRACPDTPDVFALQVADGERFTVRVQADAPVKVELSGLASGVVEEQGAELSIEGVRTGVFDRW